MKLALSIIALILALLGITLSILPFGNLAFAPIIGAFVFGLLAFRASRGDNQKTGLIKFIFLITIIALGITIYRAIFDENIIEEDIESIQNEEESLEDAKKELEDIDIDE